MAQTEVCATKNAELRLVPHKLFAHSRERQTRECVFAEKTILWKCARLFSLCGKHILPRLFENNNRILCYDRESKAEKSCRPAADGRRERYEVRDDEAAGFEPTACRLRPACRRRDGPTRSRPAGGTARGCRQEAAGSTDTSNAKKATRISGLPFLVRVTGFEPAAS